MNNNSLEEIQEFVSNNILKNSLTNIVLTVEVDNFSVSSNGSIESYSIEMNTEEAECEDAKLVLYLNNDGEVVLPINMLKESDISSDDDETSFFYEDNDKKIKITVF